MQFQNETILIMKKIQPVRTGYLERASYDETQLCMRCAVQDGSSMLRKGEDLNKKVSQETP